ncbi:MAG: MFS transporter, partial [Hyphomicrobium sp.]
SLVAARVVQGLGGAMMMPVGRLIVLRTIPKAGMIDALAWLTIPALLGPVLGPLLGGFISTYFDWRWIFWINVPVAALGVALVTRFIPDVRNGSPEPFDMIGFLLVGPGLSMFLTGATLVGLDLVPGWMVASLLAAGAVLMTIYVPHALRDDAPLIDLKLLAVPTFRAAVLGGFLFRVGVGAAPFLLPLLLQTGFGMTPFQSGLLTFATGFAAMFMKTQAAPILRQFGFRKILMYNAILSAIFSSIPALFTTSSPALLMTAIFFIGGLSRSLQFTSINTIGYADIPTEKLSRATSFTAVGQELSGAVGVSIAALGREAMMRMAGGTMTDASHFPPVFLLIAAIMAVSALVFARLPHDAGGSLLATTPQRETTVSKEGTEASEAHIGTP